MAHEITLKYSRTLSLDGFIPERFFIIALKTAKKMTGILYI